MPYQQTTQIQVRIDAKTKKAVRSILDDLGLDMSTAIKMFCKQIERTHSLPIDFGYCPHPHTFSPQKVGVLRAAVKEQKNQGKSFTSVQSLMRDLRR
ncbi:type II toxin-antitoxin system RelB/DinJ family antitoxin [Candidatus Uhrbacteria bacterium]|nr:type II toxin-antitoxin system RelB/DinJ family antitoxin [Candidatus Uhrbacteria bacterium]